MSDNSSKNISYKLSMALSAASLVKLKTDKIDLTSNRLVLVTAAGTICGNFVSDNDSDYEANFFTGSPVFQPTSKLYSAFKR